MKTRRLGRRAEGIGRIGEVGVGCWQFGGDFGKVDEETALAVLEAAVESGIDFIDTADVYGPHTSERIIGRFLRGTDADPTVASKYGQEDDVYPDGYSEDSFRRCLDGTLERLGIDCLDLLQLHCVPIEVLRRGEIFDWLREARDEGLIRNFGASVETIEEGLLCIEQEDVVSLQVIFNVFRQRIATELIAPAASRGVGIIVRLPLASGLLAGKFTVDTEFEEGDHRNYNRDGEAFSVGETFSGIPFETGLELVEEVRAILPEDRTMVQLALRWILDHEAVSVVIPGASSPRQARENAAVSDLPPLAPEVHRRLSELYEARVHGAIRGPY